MIIIIIKKTTWGIFAVCNCKEKKKGARAIIALSELSYMQSRIMDKEYISCHDETLLFNLSHYKFCKNTIKMQHIFSNYIILGGGGELILVTGGLYCGARPFNGDGGGDLLLFRSETE